MSRGSGGESDRALLKKNFKKRKHQAMLISPEQMIPNLNQLAQHLEKDKLVKLENPHKNYVFLKELNFSCFAIKGQQITINHADFLASMVKNGQIDKLVLEKCTLLEGVDKILSDLKKNFGDRSVIVSYPTPLQFDIDQQTQTAFGIEEEKRFIGTPRPLPHLVSPLVVEDSRIQKIFVVRDYLKGEGLNKENLIQICRDIVTNEYPRIKIIGLDLSGYKITKELAEVLKTHLLTKKQHGLTSIDFSSCEFDKEIGQIFISGLSNPANSKMQIRFDNSAKKEGFNEIFQTHNQKIGDTGVTSPHSEHKKQVGAKQLSVLGEFRATATAGESADFAYKVTRYLLNDLLRAFEEERHNWEYKASSVSQEFAIPVITQTKDGGRLRTLLASGTINRKEELRPITSWTKVIKYINQDILKFMRTSFKLDEGANIFDNKECWAQTDEAIIKRKQAFLLAVITFLNTEVLTSEHINKGISYKKNLIGTSDSNKVINILSYLDKHIGNNFDLIVTFNQLLQNQYFSEFCGEENLKRYKEKIQSPEQRTKTLEIIQELSQEESFDTKEVEKLNNQLVIILQNPDIYNFKINVKLNVLLFKVFQLMQGTMAADVDANAVRIKAIKNLITLGASFSDLTPATHSEGFSELKILEDKTTRINLFEDIVRNGDFNVAKMFLDNVFKEEVNEEKLPILTGRTIACLHTSETNYLNSSSHSTPYDSFFTKYFAIKGIEPFKTNQEKKYFCAKQISYIIHSRIFNKYKPIVRKLEQESKSNEAFSDDLQNRDEAPEELGVLGRYWSEDIAGLASEIIQEKEQFIAFAKAEKIQGVTNESQIEYILNSLYEENNLEIGQMFAVEESRRWIDINKDKVKAQINKIIASQVYNAVEDGYAKAGKKDQEAAQKEQKRQMAASVDKTENNLESALHEYTQQNYSGEFKERRYLDSSLFLDSSRILRMPAVARPLLNPNSTSLRPSSQPPPIVHEILESTSERKDFTHRSNFGSQNRFITEQIKTRDELIYAYRIFKRYNNIKDDNNLFEKELYKVDLRLGIRINSFYINLYALLTTKDIFNPNDTINTEAGYSYNSGTKFKFDNLATHIYSLEYISIEEYQENVENLTGFYEGRPKNLQHFADSIERLWIFQNEEFDDFSDSGIKNNKEHFSSVCKSIMEHFNIQDNSEEVFLKTLLANMNSERSYTVRELMAKILYIAEKSSVITKSSIESKQASSSIRNIGYKLQEEDLTPWIKVQLNIDDWLACSLVERMRHQNKLPCSEDLFLEKYLLIHNEFLAHKRIIEAPKEQKLFENKGGRALGTDSPSSSSDEGTTINPVIHTPKTPTPSKIRNRSHGLFPRNSGRKAKKSGVELFHISAGGVGSPIALLFQTPVEERTPAEGRTSKKKQSPDEYFAEFERQDNPFLKIIEDNFIGKKKNKRVEEFRISIENLINYISTYKYEKGEAWGVNTNHVQETLFHYNDIFKSVKHSLGIYFIQKIANDLIKKDSSAKEEVSNILRNLFGALIENREQNGILLNISDYLANEEYKKIDYSKIKIVLNLAKKQKAERNPERLVYDHPHEEKSVFNPHPSISSPLPSASPSVSFGGVESKAEDTELDSWPVLMSGVDTSDPTAEPTRKRLAYHHPVGKPSVFTPPPSISSPLPPASQSVSFGVVESKAEDIEFKSWPDLMRGFDILKSHFGISDPQAKLRNACEQHYVNKKQPLLSFNSLYFKLNDNLSQKGFFKKNVFIGNNAPLFISLVVPELNKRGRDQSLELLKDEYKKIKFDEESRIVSYKQNQASPIDTVIDSVENLKLALKIIFDNLKIKDSEKNLESLILRQFNINLSKITAYYVKLQDLYSSLKSDLELFTNTKISFKNSYLVNAKIDLEPYSILHPIVLETELGEDLSQVEKDYERRLKELSPEEFGKNSQGLSASVADQRDTVVVLHRKGARADSSMPSELHPSSSATPPLGSTPTKANQRTFAERINDGASNEKGRSLDK